MLFCFFSVMLNVKIGNILKNGSYAIFCLQVFSLLLLSVYYAFAQGASALAVVALLLYVGSYQVGVTTLTWGRK